MTETGLHIAAKRADFQIRPFMKKLGLPAKTGGAYSGPSREFRQRFIFVGNEGISGVFSFGDCRNGEPLGAFCSHILQGMDRNICFSFQQNHFQFLDEKPLSADFHQRAVKNLVTLGGYRKEFHHKSRILFFQPVFYIMGLPESQKAFPGGNGNFIFQVPAPFLHPV